MRTPRKYRIDEDFRQGAVQLVTGTGSSIAEFARDLGVNEGTLGNWCAKARAERDGGNAGLSEDERAELTRLRRENIELRMQRDVLGALHGPVGGRGDGPVAVASFIAAGEGRTPYPTHRIVSGAGVPQPWLSKWRHGDPSVRHARREKLAVDIKRLFAQHNGTYGSPRITADLHD